MKLEKNLYGFEVIRARESQELCGTLWEMKHIKTGAQLVWLENGEENKLFSISFKTLPENDKGVFHILEHSVLNGSESYPIKEPFVELLKSSMNTFLNAITFSDKTVYPVSSRNKKDFLNLTKVYLDAVFCPTIAKSPNVFYQEGWHYHLENKEDNLTYSGVVLNEMKGNFASPNTLLINGIHKLLYPDNCYQFASGGDPEYITDLTYEEFIQTYKIFYHPSNSRIYLDGDVPIEEVLKMLDEEYLSKYSKNDIKYEIKKQGQVENIEGKGYYEAIDEEEKSHMSLGKVVCDWQDREKIMAFWVLAIYLTGSNEAPLKRAILSTGLAEDTGLSIEDDIAQPCVILSVKDMDYNNRDTIKAIIRKTIDELIENGIDKCELEAIINQLKFQLRDIDEPKGLMRNMNALNTWNFDGDPMRGMTYKEVFDYLEKQLDTDYYEKLLGELPCDDNKTVAYYLLPSKTKGKDDRIAEVKKLEKIKAGWSDEDVSNIIEANNKLKSWQEKKDTREDLEKLPTLSVSEVDEIPVFLKTEYQKEGNVSILYHPTKEHDITHIHLYFSLTDCSIDDMSAFSFLTNIMGMIPTKHYSVSDLENKLKSSIGFIDYNVQVCNVKGNENSCIPQYVLTFSVLNNKIEEAIELVGEILNNTLFDDQMSKLYIKDILLQCENFMRESIVMDGRVAASRKALTHFSSSAFIEDKMEGYDFYQWLKNLDENFDEEIEVFLALMKKAQREVFNANHMTISISSDKPCIEVNKIIDMMTKDSIVEASKYMTIDVDKVQSKELICIPSSVSFATIGGNLNHYGYKFEGGLQILGTIMNFDYLWNEIRVRGGAYGCGFATSLNGDIIMTSYRDPNPSNSLNVFNKAAEFIKKYCDNDEKIDKYIISTATMQEPLMNLRSESIQADRDFFMGITEEDIIQLRKDILNIEKKDLLKYCDLLTKMAEDHATCVAASIEHKDNCGLEVVLDL
ncbi:MAG: insulinase family protein [Intestinibacter sp.]|uniref:insulinase family protein n=1 Tax=Intestinibacter sp. TaxID=1965304 RepID=UPI003F169768